MEAGCELQASGDLTPANGPRVPLDRRPSGTQCLSDVLENRLSLLSLLGTDIRFLGRPARSTTAIPTQLPRLPQRVETRHVSFPTTACHQIITSHPLGKTRGTCADKVTLLQPVWRVPQALFRMAQQWVHEADNVPPWHKQ